MTSSTQAYWQTKIAAALLIWLSLLACAQPAVADDEPERSIERLKQRYTDALLQTNADEQQVRHWMDRLTDHGYWPDIDYEDLSRGAFENQEHLKQMVAMARAYRHQSSQLRNDAALREKLLAALDYWIDEDFEAENWWHNEMGTPRRMLRITLLMHDELSEHQMEQVDRIISRASLDGVGARPGGDLVQIAEMLVQRGALMGEPEMIQQGVDAIAAELEFRTGRGVQRDWSLHHRHDRANNTTSYGAGYASAAARFIGKSADTVFALPEKDVQFVTDFYLDGIRWSLGNGIYRIPATMNRNLTRPGAVSPYGTEIARELLAASAYRSDELEQVLAVAQGDEPEWSGHRVFWRSDTVAHQRPSYHVALRMHSTRNTNTEHPHNHEGLKNHHLADGHYSVTRTGDEYRDLPGAWDWQKLPGTTVLQNQQMPGDQVQKQGKRDFVGGVSDGTYGAAAFDFESPHDPLEARRAWFFFDEGFVALGAGIATDEQATVTTSLNQSRLNGAVSGGQDGADRRFEQGTHDLQQMDWLHHDQTGYLFFEPTDVKLENRRVEGLWQRSNQQADLADREPEVAEIFTAWLDHGVAPDDAAYAYMVMPGAAVADVRSMADDGPIDVIANTPARQAVRHREAEIVQAVFYEPGQITLADGLTLKAAQPCLVLVQMADGRIKHLAVADPTQKLETLKLSVSAQLESEHVDRREDGESHLSVDLPDGAEAGRSVIVVFD